ncbi:hypothetical protein FWH13_03205 [Candidatus Saccharibacteria bacterium]|nr:hypothetical protein [Candidatus Saccharibacteria bacterium]
MAELPEKQLKRLKNLLHEAEVNLATARELLSSVVGEDGQVVLPRVTSPAVPAEGKVIEGIFDGQVMVGPDGKNYPVPANYASKSKLVEGDIMKLTITADGGFVYKQISPAPRKQVVGTLTSHDGMYYVEVNGKEYRILLASVTFFRLKEGDQVSVSVPSDDEDASWAAVEAPL